MLIPADAAAASQGSASAVGGIVGGILGGVALALAGAIAVFIVLRRKQRGPRPAQPGATSNLVSPWAPGFKLKVVSMPPALLAHPIHLQSIMRLCMNSRE